MFLSFTEPPYNTIGNFLVLKFDLKLVLIKLNVFLKSLDLGILPVPIDQIGS